MDGALTRFRRVADRYPMRVNEASGGDLAAAAKDDDATVASWVALMKHIGIGRATDAPGY